MRGPGRRRETDGRGRCGECGGGEQVRAVREKGGREVRGESQVQVVGRFGGAAVVVGSSEA